MESSSHSDVAIRGESNSTRATAKGFQTVSDTLFSKTLSAAYSVRMNETDLYTAAEAFLADSSYYPCCLLVSPEIARLQQACDALERRYHWPTLSIGAELSDALLSRAPESRSRAVKPPLISALQQRGAEPVLCVDIDLLFEPTLALDPLALLRDLSRSVRLIVTWPGSVANGTLAYAVPAHARYRTWTIDNLSPSCVVSL